MEQIKSLEEIQNFKGKYPKQLWYLFLVEMWERFTFYGMRALLGLYISHLILSANYHPLPTNELAQKVQQFSVENKEVLNESHPRYYIETSQQKDRDYAEGISNKQYGLIQAFIYAMAFLGGMFADKLFGFRKSIFWGGILMAIGTFMMALHGSLYFYLGISILIVGNGFFKPNISTMVGSLYKEGDPRRDAGFSLFYSGINLGALLSGLTIAWIGTSYSWSLGFFLAGICMLLGLGLFIFTQKSLGPIGLPPIAEKLTTKSFGIKREWLYYLASLLFIPFFFFLVYYPFEVKIGNNEVAFSDLFMWIVALIIIVYLVYTLIQVAKEEFSKLLAAVILIIFSVIFWSFFEQGGGSLNFFAVGNVESHGLNMTSVNNSINALWVVILGPIIGMVWIALSKKNKEPNTVVKFGLGFVFLGLGFLIFYMSKNYSNELGKTPLLLFCLAYLVLSIGELCLSPIGLSMVTKLSPKRFVGVMMGTWFLASAYGQYGAGLIGKALSGSGVEGVNLNNFQKLLQYTSGYYTIALISIGAGFLLIIISPIMKKLMGDVK